MHSAWKRWLWRGIKIVVSLAILGFVGLQFQRDLEKLDLETLHIRPGWLVVSALLYLVGVSPNAWFWHYILKKFGFPIPLYAALRAHYVGQLGKYAPGKALAIIIRANLVHPNGVPYGVSVITTFYEVFTGMAAGAIVAALVYMAEPPGELELEVHPVWIGLGLIGVCGVPLLPSVFNFLIARLTARIQVVQLYRLPPLRFGTLWLGLVGSVAAWWIQGLSWLALLYAVLPEPPEWSFSLWAQCAASLAFANVAGFVSGLPGGLGVREYLLSRLLGAFGPIEYLTAAAILLRLNGIAAELLCAAIVFWIKPRSEST